MQNNLCENEFHFHAHFHANQTHFLFEWFRMRSCFENEGKSNSEVAYWDESKKVKEGGGGWGYFLLGSDPEVKLDVKSCVCLCSKNKIKY